MTYALLDGPPDVDASHTWTPAHGITPPVINDWTADPITPPFIHLAQIGNWRSRPEADNLSEANVGRSGETPRPGFLRGKTLTYEIEIQAVARESLRSTLTGLINGFADTQGIGSMAVSPLSSIGGVDWMFKAKVLSLDPDPVFTYNQFLAPAWRVGAVLALRMTDGRFYINEPVSVETVADGDTQIVTNPGVAETDPTIVATVPDSSSLTDLELSNNSVGALVFHLPPHTTQLTVDFAARTAAAVVSGLTVDGLEFYDETLSTWWDGHVAGLLPGDNYLMVIGGSWTASFYPAAW